MPRGALGIRRMQHYAESTARSLRARTAPSLSGINVPGLTAEYLVYYCGQPSWAHKEAACLGIGDRVRGIFTVCFSEGSMSQHNRIAACMLMHGWHGCHAACTGTIRFPCTCPDCWARPSSCKPRNYTCCRMYFDLRACRRCALHSIWTGAAQCTVQPVHLCGTSIVICECHPLLWNDFHASRGHKIVCDAQCSGLICTRAPNTPAPACMRAVACGLTPLQGKHWICSLQHRPQTCA